jgi:hypothetical protein
LKTEKCYTIWLWCASFVSFSFFFISRIWISLKYGHRHLTRHTDTDTSTPIIIRKNDIVKCNHKCRCRIGVQYRHMFGTETTNLISVCFVGLDALSLDYLILIGLILNLLIACSNRFKNAHMLDPLLRQFKILSI